MTTTLTTATSRESLPAALAALTAALTPGRPYPVAVPSASAPKGLHHVVVVDGRVSSCDCLGWRYRHRSGHDCRHAQQVTDQLAQVAAAVHAAHALLDGRAAVTFPDAF